MLAKKSVVTLVLFLTFSAPVIIWATTGIKKVAPSDLEATNGCTTALMNISHSQYREMFHIRDGEKQIPPEPTFDSDYVGKLHHVREYQAAGGDKITVDIYPDASPFSAANPHNAQNPQLVQLDRPQAGAASRQQTRALAQRGQPPSRSHQGSPSSLVSDQETARAFALTQFAQPPDASSLDMVVKLILNDPHLLQQARGFNTAIRNSRTVELSNFGLNRYFWYRPDDSSEYAPGRILSIYRPTVGSVEFLIEHVSDNDETMGVRGRKIALLSKTELKTIAVSINSQGRKEAMENFIDSLTADEIETLKLANVMRLQLYGYFDIHQEPGAQSYSGGLSPLRQMNNLSHLAIQSHIDRTFGSIDDLMNDFEKELKRNGHYTNFIDIFSRLDPRYVMQRFGDARAYDTEFFWVITEDGQLKILPAMPKGNNLKPQLPRLAAGRNIFAGGSFFIAGVDSIDVQLDAKYYQQNDMAWGVQQSFHAGSSNINAFVQMVFAIQSGRKVSGLSAESVENWYRSGSAGAANDSAFGYGDYYDQNRRTNNDEYDFKSKMYERARTATAEPTQQTLSWNIAKDQPLEKNEFAEKLNLSLYEPQKDLTEATWAHYILHTKPSMTFKDIKKQYRRLAMQFHSDRVGSDERALAIMKKLSLAFAILDNQLKKR